MGQPTIVFCGLDHALNQLNTQSRRDDRYYFFGTPQQISEQIAEPANGCAHCSPLRGDPLPKCGALQPVGHNHPNQRQRVTFLQRPNALQASFSFT